MDPLPQEPSPATRPIVDVKYFAFVGGLLVLIIGLLAVLWTRERTARIAYRRQLTTHVCQPESLEQLFQRAMQERQGPSRAIQPEDHLPPKAISLNGRQTTALRITAAAGQRLGLRAGDVIIVAPAPASAPAPTTGQADHNEP